MNFKLVLSISIILLLSSCTLYEQEVVDDNSGLATIYIETDDGEDITSKTTYKSAMFTLRNSDGYILNYDTCRIRGRGNSTWFHPSLEKKPYQINFEDKVAMLDFPEDKRWILLANTTDKTMLRNDTALYLSRISNLEYTPESDFIQLYLNNSYNGVYQITQKVEETDSRVQIGDEGYLLEVTQYYTLKPSDIYFVTEREYWGSRFDGTGDLVICIKSPDISIGDSKYSYITEYINLIEEILYSDNFSDPEEGYRKYLDIDSFVDWFLINEISKNIDSRFFSSCYMTLVPGEKLKMGPVWDFDIAFGNCDYIGSDRDPEGFWVGSSIWINRLLQDPYFLGLVRERFDYFYSKKTEILDHIDGRALYIDAAQEKNYDRWETLGVYLWPNYEYPATYPEEIYNLKTWISDRFEWLKSINDTTTYIP